MTLIDIDKMSDIQYLKRPNDPSLAYVYSEGSRTDLPIIVFLGGFKSDMAGTKALYFEEQAKSKGQGYLRLDYSGHGESEGLFEEGTIGQWAGDAIDVICHITGQKKILLVGSSMGGWIALLLALKLDKKVHGVIGLAAAPDFTQSIYEHRFNDEERVAMDRDGIVKQDNEYSDAPYIFTKALIEDGARNQVLNKNHAIQTPLTLIQGKKDADVPWEWAEDTKKAFAASNPIIHYIDDGDHRLSRPQDLELVQSVIDKMSA